MKVKREQVALVIKEWLTEIFGEDSDIVREFSLDDFELSSFERISGAELINLVRTALLRRAGERIICLRCGEALHPVVKHTGVHKGHCPWNYYLECPSCGYQNNLAKLLRLECTCDGEEPEVFECGATSENPPFSTCCTLKHGSVCQAEIALARRCAP